MDAMSRHEAVLDRLMLAFLIVGSFVGIWHALPLLTVIFDEQYFVGGVLRAIEARSGVPLPGDVPYGTITFYLNYALQIPFLLILFVWKGFSLVSLKIYLVLHPETSYFVPRFLSAVIMSIFAIGYDRYLRSEGLALVQRFAVLSVIFCTVISTATLHTGKMWVLSTVLSSASALYTYIAFRNHSEGRPEPKYGPIFWAIACAFVSLANFPLSLIFLINIPIFLYLFRHDAVRLRAIVRATSIGAGVLLAAVAANWQNYYAEVTRHISETLGAHIQLSGESAQVTHSYVTSFFVHAEQLIVAFPLVIAVVVIALVTHSVRDKLLFRLAIGYSCMYFIAIAIIKPDLIDVGNMLHYLYPLAFFFSGMLAAIDYKKMRHVLWGFCGLQVVVFVYTLYLLSVPTTYNQAAVYIEENFVNEHALFINEIVELSLPLNKETSSLLGDWVCGSKCQYWRSSSEDSDFKPLVITPFQGKTGKVDLSSYSRVFLITGAHPVEMCATDEPIVTFQSGYSDASFVSIQDNLGNYLSADFWRLHRLGKNIRIYELTKKCAESIRWKDFEGFSAKGSSTNNLMGIRG